MSSLKALYLLLGLIVSLLLAVGLFNFRVDPNCYYRCSEVDLNRASVNTFYKTAQTIMAHPELEQIIVGSSRGQTTPPQWVEKVSGLKTVNASTAGADAGSKFVFLNLAKEKTVLKRVIWFADYFELRSEKVNGEIINTPALRVLLGSSGDVPNPWLQLSRWQSLIDHNTTEASIYFLQHHQVQKSFDPGAGSDLYESCMNPGFKGKETPESLAREVQMLYQNYVTGPIKGEQSEAAWAFFEAEMKDLVAKKVEVIVAITPYHPVFLANLKREHPQIYASHQNWIQRLHKLSSEVPFKLVDAFEGIEGDDGSPRYWNDGVHFTCVGSMKFLEGAVTTH